ncbi:F-box domain [Trinorchestia longiramus]|nr:F-box domain [Trinorchestia longiramus]
MELQADESHPNILDLPDEVMVEIFSYITPQELHKSMAAVCRRWEQVAYEPSLWRNLSVQDEDLAPCMRTNPGLNEDVRRESLSDRSWTGVPCRPPLNIDFCSQVHTSHPCKLLCRASFSEVKCDLWCVKQ